MNKLLEKTFFEILQFAFVVVLSSAFAFLIYNKSGSIFWGIVGSSMATLFVMAMHTILMPWINYFVDHKFKKKKKEE
jgi:Na+-driven multidrug efflux pump